MNKFYTSVDKMYSETDRINIQKTKKTFQKSNTKKTFQQSKKVNINTFLNRIKIEKKNKIKKNFFLFILSVVAISLSFILLLL